MHKAKWIDGFIYNWSINQTKWVRYEDDKYIIALKCLNDSQNLTTDFLQEVCSLYLLWILYL